MDTQQQQQVEEARRGIEGLLSQGRVVEALKVVLSLLRHLRRDGREAERALAAASAAAAAASEPQGATPPPPCPPSFGPADLARLLEQVSLAPPAPGDEGAAAAANVDGTHGAPSLLSERGVGAIAADAVADGSSARCARCGGVIAVRRMTQHAEWCSAIEEGEEVKKEEADGGAGDMEHD
jgi:hypothetical protein